MRTLKKQLEDDFNKLFTGHPSRQEQHDIKKIKSAILKLAQAIDNINNMI